jgi:3-isopropylmalate dehydrogenase
MVLSQPHSTTIASRQWPSTASSIESAVEQVLRHGPHSRDIGGSAGTDEVRDAVLAAIEDHADNAAAFFCGARACG